MIKKTALNLSQFKRKRERLRKANHSLWRYLKGRNKRQLGGYPKLDNES